MKQIMKAEYTQPEISVLTVYGKEFIMQEQGVIAGSNGTSAKSGDGFDDPSGADDTKGRGMDFEEKEFTYGNIW